MKTITVNKFDVIFQLNHKKDKDGFDCILTPDMITPIQLLTQLKKNNSCSLMAGPLISHNGTYWNAGISPTGEPLTFIIDYPNTTIDIYRALLSSLNKNNKWQLFYFADRNYAKLKQTNLETISIFRLGDSPLNSPKDPQIQFPFNEFKSKLVSVALEFIPFAKELLKLSELPELKLTTFFKKNLTHSIKIEQWEDIIVKLQEK